MNPDNSVEGVMGSERGDVAVGGSLLPIIGKSR